MKLSMIIIILLLLAAFFVISNERIQLNSNENLMKFGDIYYSWLLNALEKGISITGSVVKANWLPDTNSTK
jgi:hypothetical protein